ncbi:9325_t:CDS:1, partial [Acaulospora colombiana]
LQRHSTRETQELHNKRKRCITRILHILNKKATYNSDSNRKIKHIIQGKYKGFCNQTKMQNILKIHNKGIKISNGNPTGRQFILQATDK